jgi:hypothetical protein
MSKYFLVNAYPRSGSIFFTNFIYEYRPEVLSLNSLHIPYILDNPNILSVSIIRNPYHAIASFLYMNFGSEEKISSENEKLIDNIKRHVDSYSVYLDYYEKLLDVDFLHIIDFDKMEENPHDQAILVFDKFKLNYKKDKIVTAKEIREDILQHKNIQDKGGHMPREKTEQRLLIEDFVNNSKYIDEIFQRYKNVKKMI